MRTFEVKLGLGRVGERLQMVFAILNNACFVCDVCSFFFFSVTRHRKSADLLVFGLCRCKRDVCGALTHVKRREGRSFA